LLCCRHIDLYTWGWWNDYGYSWRTTYATWADKVQLHLYAMQFLNWHLICKVLLHLWPTWYDYLCSPQSNSFPFACPIPYFFLMYFHSLNGAQGRYKYMLDTKLAWIHYWSFITKTKKNTCNDPFGSCSFSDPFAFYLCLWIRASYFKWKQFQSI
jgi:hypothetical protein